MNTYTVIQKIVANHWLKIPKSIKEDYRIRSWNSEIDEAKAKLVKEWIKKNGIKLKNPVLLPANTILTYHSDSGTFKGKIIKDCYIEYLNYSVGVDAIIDCKSYIWDWAFNYSDEDAQDAAKDNFGIKGLPEKYLIKILDEIK